MPKAKRDKQNFEFDVCLSFAGEDRPYVRKVAEASKELGIRVFYDEYDIVDLWGKDLYSHLSDLYKNAARYCVLFASKHYKKKLWTNHERRSAQSRALSENTEYILPARFDDTDIPGVLDTIGYLDLRSTTPDELASFIASKIDRSGRYLYLPPIPDRLYRRLGLKTKSAKKTVYAQAEGFMDALKRMSKAEQDLIITALQIACGDELPDNVHFEMDLLCRHTGFAASKIERLLGGVNSLGFESSFRQARNAKKASRLGTSKQIVFKWHYLSTIHGGNCTQVAFEMVHGISHLHCESCGDKVLKRLDFSQLASVLTSKDGHIR
jgi:hypothetical protein